MRTGKLMRWTAGERRPAGTGPSAAIRGWCPDVSGLPCDQISDAEGEAYLRRHHLLFTRDSSIRFHHILSSDPRNERAS